ncbi:MAG: glycine cleavage system protein GcvH [Haloferacaceae archaeon]
MSFEYPDGLRYTESHEWTTTDDPTRIGITDFAQDELGDVVFVDLPDEGETVTGGEAFGVVESIKAVSDVYAPISGEVVAVNETLFDRPELVNEDPYGEGWLLEIEPSDPGERDDLLTAEEYRARVE